jgi:hypothetical protein
VLEQEQHPPTKSEAEERPAVAAGARRQGSATAGVAGSGSRAAPARTAASAAGGVAGSGSHAGPPGRTPGSAGAGPGAIADWTSGATAPMARADALAYTLAVAVGGTRPALLREPPPAVRQLQALPYATAPPAPRQAADRLLARRSLEADGPTPGAIPVNKVGVVDWDGTPELRLRSSPKTDDASVIGHLAFSTHVQVIARMPGKWYRVSTSDGQLGYVASDYVRTDPPEPLAGRHRVEGGAKGSAIAIAEHYYGAKAKDWGQDLRFYVNVLAWANNKHVPDTVDGWRSVKFEAGDKIWIPSQPFAYSLRGVLNSGSQSYEALDAVGLAGVIERLGELSEDLGAAIANSGKYMGEAIGRHVDQALWNVVTSLALMMVSAVALMATLSAIGGAIGGPAGAAAGFQLSLLLLKWLGLAFLIKWIAEAVANIATTFVKFLRSVWNARGDEHKLDGAGRDFAEAIGTLMGTIIEALVLWAASVGIGAAVGKLRSTRLGRSLGEAFFEWMGKAEPAKRRQERLRREQEATGRRDEQAPPVPAQPSSTTTEALPADPWAAVRSKHTSLSQTHAEMLHEVGVNPAAADRCLSRGITANELVDRSIEGGPRTVEIMDGLLSYKGKAQVNARAVNRVAELLRPLDEIFPGQGLFEAVHKLATTPEAMSNPASLRALLESINTGDHNKIVELTVAAKRAVAGGKVELGGGADVIDHVNHEAIQLKNIATADQRGVADNLVHATNQLAGKGAGGKLTPGVRGTEVPPNRPDGSPYTRTAELLITNERNPLFKADRGALESFVRETLAEAKNRTSVDQVRIHNGHEGSPFTIVGPF